MPHSPGPRRRAVIDIGSNSVKLLVAEVTGGTVVPVLERGHQTRLGEGSFASGRLQPAAIARTTETVAAFLREATTLGAPEIRLLATAAAREASNADELQAAVRQATGREIEILTGTVEADLAFRGVCSDARLAGVPLLVTDLGGGSTEFILGQDGIRHFARSFPIGTVRLLEALRPPESPSTADLTRCREMVDGQLRELAAGPVGDALASLPSGHPRLVAVGGTAVILARMTAGMDDYDRDRIERTEMPAETLRAWADRLWSIPVSARRQLQGLPAERADIILTGVAVYEGILKAFQIPVLRPSTRGLRFGALLDPA